MHTDCTNYGMDSWKGWARGQYDATDIMMVYGDGEFEKVVPSSLLWELLNQRMEKKAYMQKLDREWEEKYEYKSYSRPNKFESVDRDIEWYSYLLLRIHDNA